MNSDIILFQSNKFSLKLNHLVIIGVLVLAFSTSMLIRSQPMEYGFQLNEFDPFFNFRATEYIVENGLTGYFEWHDDKSWYLPPDIVGGGRDVSGTSQVMLHITAALTYQIFGMDSSLYEYTILFPAIIGSLTVIVIFGLVRLFGGTFAGLLASLLFAVSLPIIIRGTVGWFKSEPLGIFYGLLGLYLFLSAIKSENKKIAFVKIIFGGIVMSFGLSSWGGNQFFIIPIGLFILALPFVNRDHKFLLWAVPLFVGILLSICGLFERPGISFVYGIGGLSLIVPTIFLISCIFIQKISSKKNKTRNGLLLLFSIIIIGSFLVSINEELQFLSLPTFRYLNALNPFLTSTDPLTDSVAEHASTSIEYSFLFHSIWMIFAGIGVWLLLSKKNLQDKFSIRNDMRIFILIFGITGIYVSSVFIRLEVFASLALIILASVGLSILTKEIFKNNLSKQKNYLIKSSFVVIIISLFLTPLVIPENSNWVNNADQPPIILTGGTSNPPTGDWLYAMEWLKTNTPENAVIASWWDYGYWISTLSERTTIIDNATINDTPIIKMAKMFMSSPDDSWKILQEMNADYVVVFVSFINIGYSEQQIPIYQIGGGGDESKIFWIAQIAELPIQNYLTSDYTFPHSNFYENTMLGKMIPFNPEVYYHPETTEHSLTFQPGFVEISSKKIKYDSDTDPVRLVYASPGFNSDEQGTKTSVLVYEVNKNFIP